MPYVSLYRKYRPQQFADVAGQEHVVTTLQNALRAGRIANGYLFCGTRGVAKTTIARIFAKCLNCVGPDGTGIAPVAEPCNQCGPCRSISAGQCVDVIEMDAASNRSVTDMARIRENVQFGPMENRFKTYIVDEAHQLTADAKDAFLKTLEEPPAGVVFILATTESHAIPITIASRCQQFDFKRGSLETISSQIDRVIQAEKVEMAPDAVAFVARAAEGSYRDALSLLEQVLAYKRTGVTVDDVAEVLGAVDSQVVDDVVEMIAKSDAAAAFALAERIFTDGKDVRQFLKALAGRFRDLLYVSVGARVSGESGLAGDARALSAQSKLFKPAHLLRAMEILADAERETKFAAQHRLLLEMALLRLIDLPGSQPAAVQAATAASSPAPVERPAAAGPAPSAHAPSPRPIREHAPPRTAPQPAPSAAPAPIKLPEPPPSFAAQPSAAGAQAGADTVVYLRSHWREVLNHVQARSAGGVRVFTDALPIRQEGSIIVLGFNNKAYVDMLDSPNRRKFIEEIICKVIRAEAGSIKVRGVLNAQGDSADAATSVPAPPPAEPPVQATMEDDSPKLDEVISIFGGNIIEE